MYNSEECTDEKLCGNKAGQVRSYIWKKEKRRCVWVGRGMGGVHNHPLNPEGEKKLLGGLNEITPQKIELARPTERRNARN